MANDDKILEYIRDNSESIFYEKIDLIVDLGACRLVTTKNLSLLKDSVSAIRNGDDEVAIELISRVTDSFEKMLQETAYNPKEGK